MTRICVFCESWESGGIEAFLRNVLCPMDLTGLEIDIVAARLGESLFTAPLVARGVHFYELSGKANRTGPNHRAFRKLLAERRYDVVHLNLFQGLSLAYARLAKEAGVSVRIAHSHNTDLRQSPTRRLKLLLHRWGRDRYGADCTDFWACSRAAAEFLFGQGRAFRFIPNGIEADRFRFDPAVRAKVRRELGVGDAFVLGSVGRLCYQKNQSFLLDVFSQVLRRRPDSRLLLVGEGEDLPALRERAGALGITEKVIFYGLSDHVEELFWAMDAFVMPSRFEGLPVTAVEAQGAGLPCLFSDAVTQEVQLGAQAEFLPLTASADKWAGTLLAMKPPENREAGAAAVQKAGFGVQDVSRQIQEFYLRGR